MTPVEILNNEYTSILNFLNSESQPSLSSDLNKHFKKVIILSSASYFEHKIQELLVNFISKKTDNDLMALNFFKKKAISMQYHTYFYWGDKGDQINQVKMQMYFSLYLEMILKKKLN